MKKKRQNKKRDLFQLFFSIAIIILCNFIGSFVFHRFDLTSEKRFTLSESSKKLAEKLNDVVFFKIYLDGDYLPAGLIRLKNETKEMLDEFRAYSNGNIQYEFIDPSANPDKKQRDNIYRQLYKQGLNPTTLEVRNNGGSSQHILFPGAIVTYKDRTLPMQLLKQQVGVPPDQVLNNSVQALEYDIANTIHQLSIPIKPVVAFIEGQSELDTTHVKDITKSLQQYYEVKRIKINHNLHALDDVRTIIIAKPDSAFDEKDKFIIDQYIMKGGRALWLIDPVYTSFDSLRESGYTMGIPNNLNLEDQLFQYGVRLNKNMILDLQCAAIPINVAYAGTRPRWKLMPWYFNPLIQPTSNNPIVKNLDMIEMQFASSLDTVGAKGIKKTILLRTSKYTKLLNTPARASLGIVNVKPDEAQFNQSYQPVAVLLQGKFHSLYTNRIPPSIAHNKEIGFKEVSKKTKMIVVSDGDVIKNDVRESTGKPFPLGYDIYTQQTYGNKNFILNCVNYLCDDSGLMSIREKSVKLRLLDKKRISRERLQWQLINTALPVILLILFGIGQSVVRKRKYTS